jgi:Tfp pilus assembly protein PilF
MKYLILSISLALTLGAFAQPGNGTLQAFKAEKLFGEGKMLYEDSDFLKAIAIFDEVAILNPNHSQVFLYRAESYYALGDFEKALDDFTKAADLQPGNPEIRNSLGTAAAKLGLYDAAAAYFYEALKIDPNHTGAQTNLAQVEKLRKERDPYAKPINEEGWVVENNKPGNNQGNPYDNNYPNTNYPGSNSFPNNSFPENNFPDNPFPNSDPVINNQGGEVVSTSRVGKTYDAKNIVVGHQRDNGLRILRIRFTDNSTIITLEITAVGAEPFPLKLGAINSQEAFYLADQSMRPVARLKNVTGLSTWPNRIYNLRPRERKVISLEFESLDENVSIFHLLEGQGNRPISWDFYEIELKG